MLRDIMRYLNNPKASIVLLTIFSFFLLSGGSLTAQNQHPQDYFAPPMDIPWKIAGSFAELRTNHFHAGIDIPTGTIGKNLYSIADGYVSRIKTKPTGYGLVVYIDHPNGYTSVYGHMDSFNEDIAAFVMEAQYRHKQSIVDLYPAPGQLPVKKGQIIGKSGNTGRSSGPHLHFEIRETESEHALNPMQFGYKIIDTEKPVIKKLFAYPMDPNSRVDGSSTRNSYTVTGANGAYSAPTIKAKGKIGFAIHVNDYITGSSATCGIYSIELRVDSNRIYFFELDHMDFEESRYINSHIDFDYNYRNGAKIHKVFKDPGNQLTNYSSLVNNGVFICNDDQQHKVEIITKDTYGNTAVLKFNLQGAGSGYVPVSRFTSCKTIVPYDTAFTISEGAFTATIPKGALYDTICLNYSVSGPIAGSLSGSLALHNDITPIQYPVEIRIKVDSSIKVPHNKLVIAKVTGSSKYYLGGSCEGNEVVAKSRTFGTFALFSDTSPPSITSMNTSETNFSGTKTIKYKLADGFSGINTYDGYIDGKWVLFEINYKTNVITHTLDKKNLKRDKKHILELVVTDNSGNESKYKTEFTL